MPSWLTSALAFDRRGLHPTTALRAALGVVIPLVIGLAIGHPADGAIAAAGALPVGVAAMGHPLPTAPVGLLLATSAGMAISTFVGSLSAGHLLAVCLTLAIWGFAAGLLVTAGRAATVVGVQAVVGLIVFGRYPGGVDTSALHAGAVLVGGLAQTLFTAVVRPITAYAAERAAVVSSLVKVAELADDGGSGLASGEALASARDVLARRALDVPMLGDLVDDASRVRLELQALQSVADVPGVRPAMRATAAWLRRSTAAMKDLRAPPDEDPVLAGLVDRLRGGVDSDGTARERTRRQFAADRAAALLGQLRAIDRLAGALAGQRRFRLPRVSGVRTVMEVPSRMRDIVEQMRDAARDPKAPAFRHAVRLAVLLPFASLISTLLPWQRGYWVPLTTLVVLKPDYAATIQRGVARVIGTGLGVVLAGLLVATVHPRGSALVAAIAVLTWASYAVFSASYTLYSFALTALVVLLVSTGDPKPLSAVADRGLDTLLGGAIALIGFAAWPTREDATLRATVARLFEALAEYADVVLRGYADPSAVDPVALPSAARAARRARADALASYDRAESEPSRFRPDIQRAAGLLGAARRVVLSLHALRTVVHDIDESIALPEALPVVDNITRALRQLAAAVRSGTEPELPPLREDVLRIEALTETLDDPVRSRRAAVLAAHLDPLVDSIDTAAHGLQEAAAEDLVGFGKRRVRGGRHAVADELA